MEMKWDGIVADPCRLALCWESEDLSLRALVIGTGDGKRGLMVGCWGGGEREGRMVGCWDGGGVREGGREVRR